MLAAVLIGLPFTTAKYNNCIEYFDSFGLAPAQECIQLMKSSNKPIEYNSSQIQNIDSIMCGYYCIYYISQRSKDRKPVDILLDFKQKPDMVNELIIQEFAHNII